jgi:glycosidase
MVNHAFDGELEGLEAGKQTLRFEAADVDGRVAEPLRLPFWVESTPFDYRDSAIYMVMLDRFRDGDASNNPAATVDAEPTADWHGGDLAGLADAITEGYFDTLGVRTLWLSPFVRNPDHSEISGDGQHRVTGYHGYWPTRAREVDPRFGTAADLEAVVTAAHAHGIRILMDFVLNHVHEEHEHYANHPEWFRTGCVCGTANCDWTDHRLDCLFMTYLPDVNWTVTEASETLISDALWWIERFDLDGMRVDAVKHVEDGAIFNLSIRVHEAFEQGGTEHFLLGETAMGWGGADVNNSLNDYHTISRYIGESGLNGQFDFVLYHAVSYNTWAESTYGLLHADYWLQQSLIHYPAGAIMTPYLGSHDTSRFVTLADPGSVGREYNQWSNLPSAPATSEAYDRLRVGLAWLLTLPGAPLLYYGDEYGEFGAADPDNRHLFRQAASRTATETALFEFVSALGTARRVSTGLRRGEYLSLLAEEQFLAYARFTATDLAVVCLNTSTDPVTRSVPLPGNLPIPVVGFEDALVAGSEYAVVGGSVTVTVPARSAVVLVPFGS